MKYIELTELDIDYIDNRAVICSYMDGVVTYEPIPEILSDYFEGRERKELVIINTEILKVEYDWNNEKAYITIADTNFPGPHEFDCIGTWTEQDCINAINSKFN